jgi:hypothetical protein
MYTVLVFNVGTLIVCSCGHITRYTNQCLNLALLQCSMFLFSKSYTVHLISQIHTILSWSVSYYIKLVSILLY